MNNSLIYYLTTTAGLPTVLAAAGIGFWFLAVVGVLHVKSLREELTWVQRTTFAVLGALLLFLAMLPKIPPFRPTVDYMDYEVKVYAGASAKPENDDSYRKLLLNQSTDIEFTPDLPEHAKIVAVWINAVEFRESQWLFSRLAVFKRDMQSFTLRAIPYTEFNTKLTITILYQRP